MKEEKKSLQKKGNEICSFLPDSQINLSINLLLSYKLIVCWNYSTLEMKTIYPTTKSDSSPFVLNHILAELYKIKVIISVSVFCSSIFSSVLSVLHYSATNPDPGL